MRWRVKINEKSGDDLPDVLEELGYDLVGDMLSGEPFDKLDNSVAVFNAARELGHIVREIARLAPDLEISFKPGNVHEYGEGGEEIASHVCIISTPATLVLTGHSPSVINSSITDEELAETRRRNRVERAVKHIRAAMKNGKVLTVMRLLDDEPGPLELGHVHDLIEDDVGGNLSRFASNARLDRFNRSINHPDVHGLRARHAVTNAKPPPNPMNIDEATQFITDIAERWISEIASGIMGARNT